MFVRSCSQSAAPDANAFHWWLLRLVICIILDLLTLPSSLALSNRTKRGKLTSAKCDSLMRDNHGKFWSMFPPTVLHHRFRRVGGPSCFGGDNASVARFWKAALHGGDGRGTGRGCDTNWIRGSRTQGTPDARPLHGPVLFGLDPEIYAFCERLNGFASPRTQFVEGKHSTQKLIDSCLPHRNIIRVLDNPRWNMCTNIEWQACVVQGLLPGQPHTADAEFAVAPKDLPMSLFEHPPGVPGGQSMWGWATSDIFFFEVCFFNQVCKNKQDLFTVGVGESFRCKFDVRAFGELRWLLQ